MAEPAPTTKRHIAGADEKHLERLDRRHYSGHTRIAFGAMCGLVLLLAVGMTLWLLVSTGPTVVAERFVELAASGKADRAYVETSSIGLRQRMSLEQFMDLLNQLHLYGVKTVTWTVNHKDPDRANVLGQVVLDSGATETLAMSFIEEFDDWKVDDLGLVLPR